MGAMGVMALALSVVGGAIGAGLGVGALSGMWGIPAVVAVATVGVVTVGVVGGGAGGGRGSVAACSAPADSACAPAAAGGVSRLTPWSRNQVWASPPMVSSNTRCVASIMLDIAVAPTWSAMAFDCSMTAFTAATLASIGPLPARIWLIC
ncbi:Conserved exported protein of uncharacterised function [Mycobacterium tuberculosis]|nr:Conserved exported protein of uncharacterised function [Mycobacterium tuberculosis]